MKLTSRDTSQNIDYHWLGKWGSYWKQHNGNFWNAGKLTDLDLSVDYMGACMFNIHWGVYFRFEHFTKYMLYLTEQTKTKRY